MPGICGFYDSSPQPGEATLVDDMLSGLRASHDRLVHRYVDPRNGFALGIAALGTVAVARQPAACPSNDLLAVVDGELYDMDLITSGLCSRGHNVDGNDYAAALLHTYADGGIDAVAELEGSFAAAIVDASKQTLTLVSDRFGTRPVYYAQAGERFSFASRIAALLTDAGVPRDLSWTGISQFFTFGHYFNDDTSLTAVKILPAGAVLTYDALKNRATIERYWHGVNRIGQIPSSRLEACEAVDDAFLHAVRRRQAGSARLGISLSGGLDARSILGVFDRPDEGLETICLGMHGSQDHRASRELARIVGSRHHSHVLDSSFLGEFGRHLENMVRLTDGQYLSQCIVMPTLPLYREFGVEALFRGHAGELLHMSKAYNYSMDVSALGLSSEAALDDWLWKRLQGYLRDGVEGPLFARPELQGQQSARESLRQALAATPQSEPPAQRIVHLFLDQRVRRETMLSMMKFRTVVEPRLPYLDRVLVERLLAIPVEWKLDDELQTYILRKRQPRFCDVANTNTGAVLGAGRARRSFSKLKNRVFSKLGVPGYQPYERLGLWLKRDLAGLVRSTLLTDSCLDRGIFAPDTMRKSSSGISPASATIPI